MNHYLNSKICPGVNTYKVGPTIAWVVAIFITHIFSAPGTEPPTKSPRLLGARRVCGTGPRTNLCLMFCLFQTAKGPVQVWRDHEQDEMLGQQHGRLACSWRYSPTQVDAGGAGSPSFRWKRSGRYDFGSIDYLFTILSEQVKFTILYSVL